MAHASKYRIPTILARHATLIGNSKTSATPQKSKKKSQPVKEENCPILEMASGTISACEQLPHD